MSWLYSLIFAGLLFSSDATSPANKAADKQKEEILLLQDAADVTEKFEQVYPLDANGIVSVSNINGSISIETWQQNEVKLEALKIADSPEALASIRLDIESTPRRFKVEADFEKREPATEKRIKGKREVQFKLWVPPTATLDEIETVNGSVSVRNFSVNTKVSAVNGNITAVNLGGSVSLSTVNGEILADFTAVTAASRIDLETVNGTVKAVFPSDVDALIKADSLNGDINNDFGLPVRKGRYVGRNLSGRIGSGTARIKLSSVNGGLAIQKKNDGKTVKPSVNLLDENSEDDALDVHMRLPKIAREEMERGIKAAVKEAEVNMIAAAEAQKAIAAMMPELVKIPVESIAKIESEFSSEEFKAKMREAAAAQSAVLARMRDVNWPRVPTTLHQRTNSFRVKSGAQVSIEAKGCDVRITGSESPEVKYVVTEEADSYNSKPVEIVEQQTDNQLSLKFINVLGKPYSPGSHNRENRVRVDISVPAKTNLRLNADGEIRVSRITGTVELSASDQSVNLRDIEGKVTLEASGALVRLVGFKGEFDSKTDSGDVYLEGEFSRITSSSGEGSVVLSVAKDANFDISANTEVETEGILLSRGADNSYRVGSGGPVYRFDLGSGNLLIKRAYASGIF